MNHRLCGECAMLSYSWQCKAHPDPDGRKADVFREFLQGHSEIKRVWIDWCSLPQKERSKQEHLTFQEGLRNLTMVPLSATVVILLSESYLARFWTQYEAFMSFQ